jgi:hypothetical protein
VYAISPGVQVANNGCAVVETRGTFPEKVQRPRHFGRLERAIMIGGAGAIAPIVTIYETITVIIQSVIADFRNSSLGKSGTQAEEQDNRKDEVTHCRNWDGVGYDIRFIHRVTRSRPVNKPNVITHVEQ